MTDTPGDSDPATDKDSAGKDSAIKTNGAPPADAQSSGRTAARGMAWTALSLVVSKLLSFGSQVALGYLLAVDTYAVFALLTTAMIFVNGFQNPGVSKVLIQQHDRLDEILPDYSAFALWLGSIGLVLFLVVGIGFEMTYDVRPLFWVIALAALSIPLKAATTVYMAVMSVNYDFRAISMAEMKRSLFYYIVLVGAAALGAAGYTMALALVGATVVHVVLLKRATPGLRLSWKLSPRRFWQMTMEMRWVLLSAFLFALGMNGDYLLLGEMLTAEELGYYFFGFTLVANLTVMISMGINQALLPLFSKLKHDLPQLRRQYLRISGAVTLMMSIICIGLVGVGPVLVHLVWGGKWDPAIVVVVSIAAILPVRLTANLAGVVFESQGAWGWRLVTLIWDAGFILLCAFVGATLGGFTGATIAVALQRLVSGLLTFPLAASKIGIAPRRTASFFARCFTVYGIVVAAMLLADPWRGVTVHEGTLILRPVLETSAALAVFLAYNLAFNRELMIAMLGILRRKNTP
ncbi:polysaccharide biosynthesis protein [Citreicella sp. 357]|nr:polysaccharide biosynthesis protein [Citreicella sp. 357]